jgi:hypothetical protein
MKLQDITNEETLDWLLEKENPSVRSYTLTSLLGKPQDDAKLLESKREIMTCGVVPKLLASQNEDGYWGAPERFYLDKYCGTIWQLLILAEFGADPMNKQRKKRVSLFYKMPRITKAQVFPSTDPARPGAEGTAK